MPVNTVFRTGRRVICDLLSGTASCWQRETRFVTLKAKACRNNIMSESVRTNTSIWSKGMLSVIVAQFLSGFGDNALLYRDAGTAESFPFYPDWSHHLQMVFVGAYILLRRLSAR